MAILLFAGVAPVVAASQLPADFSRLDTNHDQRLSRIEVPPLSMLKQHFANFDRNHDGLLDAGELAQAERTVRISREAGQTSSLRDRMPSEPQPAPAPPVGYVNNSSGSKGSSGH
ncbi:hypothetical protein ACFWZU_02400 [Frateuria sp. GZRR33]|uniref:hypothetical protein n=1 Tax=Frateuria sp. GZRR33 TaxID=3351535 RepID=UPI003EDBFB75